MASDPPLCRKLPHSFTADLERLQTVGGAASTQQQLQPAGFGRLDEWGIWVLLCNKMTSSDMGKARLVCKAWCSAIGDSLHTLLFYPVAAFAEAEQDSGTGTASSDNDELDSNYYAPLLELAHQCGSTHAPLGARGTGGVLRLGSQTFDAPGFATCIFTCNVLRDLRKVFIYPPCDRFGDQCFAACISLSGLEVLSVCGADSLTDEGVSDAMGSSEGFYSPLCVLELQNNKHITSIAFAELHNMQRLEHLDVSGTSVCDALSEYAAQAESLECLVMVDCPWVRGKKIIHFAAHSV